MICQVSIPQHIIKMIVTILLLCFVHFGSSVRHKCYENGCVEKRHNVINGTELRIAHKDFLSMETSVTYNDNTELLKLREISNGKRVIKVLYNLQNDMLDCDILNSTKEIHKFWRKFFLRKASNRSLHRRIRQWSRNSNVEVISKSDTESLYGKKYLQMLDMKVNCLAFKRQVKTEMQENILKSLSKSPLSDLQSHPEQYFSLSRKKRSMLIFPGTKWCGKGNTAEHFDDLGENNETDVCCRDHDQCPYTIQAFSSNYHLFNYRFYTVSHCECDERFLQCLQKSGNKFAEKIGYIYFHMVASKCFVFRPQKVCEGRAWWGRCKEYKTQYGAALKGPLKF